MTEEERFEVGMMIRRTVLGDEHVDRAQSRKTVFNADFQDLITRYAWGEIWARPGLARSTRSLLTIALMVALGRDEELRMHLSAAVRIGVPPAEVRETLLQCAIYCGLPAANHAFQLADEVFSEVDLKPKA